MLTISTSTAFSNIVANINAALAQETQIAAQVSSGSNATDLQGYSNHSETLIAMQTVQAQISGFLTTGQVLTAKLSTQDTALGQVASAATSASKAVTDALAANDSTALMQSLQTAMNDAVQGMNTTFNGQYVFGGGQVTTPPVSATSLGQLTSAPSLASLFHNDNVVQSAQVNQNTTLQTGFLASSLGTPLFTVLQNIVAYSQGPNGPLTGQLNDVQTAFLQSQIATLNTVSSQLNDAAGANGLNQSEVESAQTDLGNQQTTLKTLTGNITSTDMAQASANLQQAQLAIQASARVFQSLSSSSLINLLPMPSA